MCMTYQKLLSLLKPTSGAAKVVAHLDGKVNLRELGKALDEAGLTNRQIAKVHQVLQENQVTSAPPPSDPFEGLC